MSHSQKQDLGAQHGQYNGGNTDLTCRNTDLARRNKIWGHSTVSTTAAALILLAETLISLAETRSGGTARSVQRRQH